VQEGVSEVCPAHCRGCAGLFGDVCAVGVKGRESGGLFTVFSAGLARLLASRPTQGGVHYGMRGDEE